MGYSSESNASKASDLAMTAGVSAGCAGVDAALAYGIATIAKVAVPSKLVILGVTFGVSFSVAFFALCMCKAASDADDYMDELNERGGFRPTSY